MKRMYAPLKSSSRCLAFPDFKPASDCIACHIKVAFDVSELPLVHDHGQRMDFIQSRKTAENGDSEGTPLRATCIPLFQHLGHCERLARKAPGFLRRIRVL
jgi:hypothetical protein